MKKRFSDEQIVRIVGESRVSGVPATAKKHGVSTHTLYVWRRKFAGFEVRQVAELKRLQQENLRLKKMVADQTLALDVAKEALAKKS
jgi:putative transposase